MTTLPTEPISVPSRARHRAQSRPLTTPAQPRESMGRHVDRLIDDARSNAFAADLDEIPDPPAMPLPAATHTRRPIVPPLVPVSVAAKASLLGRLRGWMDPLSRPLPALGLDDTEVP